jgi:hypothetical protein
MKKYPRRGCGVGLSWTVFGMVGLKDRFDHHAAGRKRSRIRVRWCSESRNLQVIRYKAAAKAALQIAGFYGATEVAPLQSQVALFSS